jgi:multiple antibiotic resistance protein
VGINAFVLLSAAMLLGASILSLFGVSLTALRIGGGLLLLVNGYKLLNSEDVDCNQPERHVQLSPDALKRLAFYPLTFPLSVGPGSLSIAITLGANLNPQATPFVDSLLFSLLGFGVVSIILFLCYRSARRLSEILGSTGTVVLLRLSAFFLLCIGVQILMNGMTEFMRTMGRVR